MFHASFMPRIHTTPSRESRRNTLAIFPVAEGSRRGERRAMNVLLEAEMLSFDGLISYLPQAIPPVFTRCNKPVNEPRVVFRLIRIREFSVKSRLLRE